MTMVGQTRFRERAVYGLGAAALALLVLVASTLSAAAQQSPAAYMQRVANELIAAQRSGSQAD
ncbi:MAG TPA: toluene tolerance protein, partial [Hyphomicrobium sp.]|nr:toluene tolerance protein [Hyphomicrobium sp.]